MQNPLLSIPPTPPAQQRLHPKEISIKQRREKRLIDEDFDAKAEDVGGVVEVVAQEEEPFVSRDCADGADYHGAEAADGLVLGVDEDVAGDCLGAEVAEVVYY